MVSKVEELRDRLMEPVETWIASIEGEWSVDLTHEKVDFESVLGSLISAAHASGVAEGAERERQRVRDEEEAESLRHDQECDRRARQKELGIDGLCDYIRTHPHDPSVLAPTKEES